MKSALIMLSVIVLAILTFGPVTGYQGDTASAGPIGSDEYPQRLHRAQHGQKGMHERHQFRGHEGRHREISRKGKDLAAKKLMRHAEELKLTDEQMEKLEDLAYTVQLKLIDLRTAIEKERLEVERQLHSDGDDLAGIERSLNIIAKMRVDIHMARLSNWIDAKKILTAEQKQLIKEKHPRLGKSLAD